MPIEYNDQFFIIDPSFPPPSGTVLNPVNYTLIDTDEDNFIESGETINGRTIASVFNGDTITVTMNGVTTTITGTTFYLNGPGPNAVFTPSSPGDTTVLS